MWNLVVHASVVHWLGHHLVTVEKRVRSPSVALAQPRVSPGQPDCHNGVAKVESLWEAGLEQHVTDRGECALPDFKPYRERLTGVYISFTSPGMVAQMEEHSSETRERVGSNPTLTTGFTVVQTAEPGQRRLEVPGSNPGREIHSGVA